MTDIWGNSFPVNPGAEGDDLVIVATDALRTFFDRVEDGSLLEGFFGAHQIAMPAHTSIC